jgi:phosphatidylinositol alpha-mannosyltransferase
VATFHASGNLAWMRLATPVWGFLADRIDTRIAVSEQARVTAQRWLGGEYTIVPNGVFVPENADAGARADHVVFIGRHEARKGMQILLRAWPEIHRRTGARLRLVGADPLAVRLVLNRERVGDEGIDILGVLSDDDLTAELLAAKVLVASSLGGESFGMVLTRALACAVPVVASDIPGYRAVVEPEIGVLFPPGDHDALAAAVVELLADEPLRQRRGNAGRELVQERYAWETIAGRLLEIYEDVAGRVSMPA